ncbi:hypothetical protein [Arthrobacter roseus]|uniref:hypothetical protein n=1 Tax=Arthrobacter roseus TaxID=136274 RepID=UPI0019622D86|nr:hypothetical protein [Arthrobacter roseus]MBM7846858.1 2-polyprenyl-6-methoxyphenol hydroxylase-like FAD-dependent oxidoreductase [Arthrobacter roseus]
MPLVWVTTSLQLGSTATVSSDGGPSLRIDGGIENFDLVVDRGVLREVFSSWHRPIADLIEATPCSAILRHDIYDLADLPPTFATRCGVLLGDAARAMAPDLGQGAGQAIEDATTLILLLRQTRDHPSDLGAALSRYDQLRRARIEAL